MIGLSSIYALAGLLFFAVALRIGFDRAEPRRLRASVFFALVGASFLIGDQISDLANGGLALLLAALATAGALDGAKGPEAPLHPPQASGFRLLVPALAIPLIAFAGAGLLPLVRFGALPLLQAGAKTLPALAGLTLGVLVALALSFALLKVRAAEPIEGARGLMQALGWMALLPQMLAALGVVFAFAGVGQAISDLFSHILPADNRLAAVIAYCLGMALFTMALGNAFAAFPVMTAGIGLPILVGRFHADPAAIGAIGMLSGFCGTLATPLAANFNLAPAALLGLKDRYGVIRVQAPTAALILAGNIVLMSLLAFHP